MEDELTGITGLDGSGVVGERVSLCLLIIRINY